MNKQFLSYEDHPQYIELISAGEWTLQSASQIEKYLAAIPHNKKILWDVSHIVKFDSAGILLFIEYFERFKKESEVEVVGYTKEQKAMYTLLQKKDIEEVIVLPKETILEKIGQKTVELYQEFNDFVTFLGRLSSAFFHTIMHPGDIRYKEVIYHIHKSGFNALLIVGLSAFLVGLVIAYQSGVQLAKFGADLFIVDTVAISITREMGPMITAIVIAGRSGSAYTAEIGAMKITEEIAAMRTMGFDPYYFLVLPRIFALMIALPLLIFFADIMGIFGGMVVSSMQLNISMGQFIERLNEVLEVKHYILGMIKGPVFAFLISAVGCYRGLQVSDNTESIGLHTTASVVNSIFLVIAFDALFSVIYTELDL